MGAQIAYTERTKVIFVKQVVVKREATLRHGKTKTSARYVIKDVGQPLRDQGVFALQDTGECFIFLIFAVFGCNIGQK